MLRGVLHNRGADGRCTECGEPFPCPIRVAIYEAVKRELEHPTPPPAPPVPPVTTPAIAQPPVLYSSRWEDLDDREDRCPRCLHWWVTHGAEPDAEGCLSIESSMTERQAMADRERELQRQGVPPEVAGPQAYRGVRFCGCQERPQPGSEWADRLAREAKRLRAYDTRREGPQGLNGGP